MMQFYAIYAVLAGLGVEAVVQPVSERKPAPGFRLADASGKLNRLSSFRGRVVVLNFWATECGGCVREIPWFMDFDRLYRSKGLDVIGVSMDILYEDLKGPEEGWQRVKPFVKAKGLAYPILMGDDSVTKGYGIEALPATYLLDKQGRVAAKYIGLIDRSNIEDNFKMLLKERLR